MNIATCLCVVLMTSLVTCDDVIDSMERRSVWRLDACRQCLLGERSSCAECSARIAHRVVPYYIQKRSEGADAMSVWRGTTNANCCRLFGLPECCDAVLSGSLNKRRFMTSYIPLSTQYSMASCSCCNPEHGPFDPRCCSINCF